MTQAAKDEGMKSGWQPDLQRLLLVVPFPNRIRQLRSSKGFLNNWEFIRTLQAAPKPNSLADLKFSALETILRRIEAGELVPDPDALEVIARVLDIAPAELVHDKFSPSERADWAAENTKFDFDTDEYEQTTTLAAILRWVREARKLSQPAITRAYGISGTNYYRMEQSERPLSRMAAQTKKQIAALFQLPSFDDVMAFAKSMRGAGALDSALELLSLPVTRMTRTHDRLRNLDSQFGTDLARDSADVIPIARAKLGRIEGRFGREVHDFLAGITGSGVPQDVRDLAGKVAAAPVVVPSSPKTAARKASAPAATPPAAGANDAGYAEPEAAARRVAEQVEPFKRTRAPLFETRVVWHPHNGVAASYVGAFPLPFGNMAPLGLLRPKGDEWRLVIGDEPNEKDLVVIAVITDHSDEATRMHRRRAGFIDR